MASVASDPRQAGPRTLQIRPKRTLVAVLNRTLFWILVAGILLYTIFPFYWAVIAAIRPDRDMGVISYWPDKIYWGNLSTSLKMATSCVHC